MVSSKHFGSLLGATLLVPLLALTACEGYEPGDTQEDTAERQEEARPGQQQQQQREEQRATPGQQEEYTQPETRRQRREADKPMTEEPDRPAPPTSESAEAMTMTEFSVKIPQDGLEGMKEGSHTLTCTVPESARTDETTARQQEQTRAQQQEPVTLEITVEKKRPESDTLNW